VGRMALVQLEEVRMGQQLGHKELEPVVRMQLQVVDHKLPLEQVVVHMGQELVHKRLRLVEVVGHKLPLVVGHKLPLEQVVVRMGQELVHKRLQVVEVVGHKLALVEDHKP